MIKSVKGWLGAHPKAKRAIIATLIVVAILLVLLAVVKNDYKWLYIGIGLVIIYIFRPGSALHALTCEKKSIDKTILAALVAMITALFCIVPMGDLPLWNGEQPGHRNQYELMAESILEGRIDFNYGDEDELAGLENPYDPDERKEAGVKYHWDHAYYNGHYYMYFGIVPVFLVFLPYRVHY